jgi:hypothetical protein
MNTTVGDSACSKRPLLADKTVGIAEAERPGALTRDAHFLANYIPNPSPLFRVRFNSY